MSDYITSNFTEEIDEEEEKVRISNKKKDDKYSYKYIFKVILIGDSNAGKTSLINRYVYNSFQSEYMCTIGVDFMMKKIVLDDKTSAKLQIWDTAGMEKYKQITTSYYRGAQSAIVVFDLTNKKSFESVPKWVDDFCKISNPQIHQTIYIVGNKNDLNDQREVTQDEIDKYIQLNNFKYFESSAKTGCGVEELFKNLTIDLIQKYKNNAVTCSSLNNIGNSVILCTDVKEIKQVKKKYCC